MERPAPEDRLGEAARLVARGLRRPALPPVAIGLIARAADAAAIALAAWFARYAVAPPASPDLASVVWPLVSGLLAPILLGALAAYRLAALARWARGWLRAALVGALAILAPAAFGAAGPDAATLLPAALVAAPLALAPGRALVAAIARWARDYGLTERRAVIVGGGPAAAGLIRGLADNPENDIRICAIFDDRADDRSPAAVIGVPKLGAVADLVDFARAAEIDLLIVTLPLEAEARIREILDSVKVLPLDVRLAAFSAGFGFPRREGLVELVRRPLLAPDRLAKRAFDLAVAAPLLVALAPLLALVALAIRLDSPGPVLFRQLRHGYNHRPIEVLKFRSMRIETCDPRARDVVTRGDPRVTRVGRVIRRFSLDELPQLLNVIRGDLSLVGPRPHALDAVSSRREPFESIVEGYAARHRVPPGITGWAQIHGWRGEIDDPEKLRRRVEHDLYYIENRSLWLDLKVLLLTPIRLLDARGAY